MATTLRIGNSMPTLEGATQWVQQEVSHSDLESHIVIVHFWAISCVHCVQNIPVLEEWKQSYRNRKVAFVAVHLPRTRADKDLEAVIESVQQRGLSGPCAFDGEKAIAEKFGAGSVWPHYFLFDREAHMRSRACGTAGFNMTRTALDRLLAREDIIRPDAK